MNAVLRLLAFAAVLAAIFVVSLGVGAAVGPIDNTPERPAPATSVPDHQGGHG